MMNETLIDPFDLPRPAHAGDGAAVARVKVRLRGDTEAAGKAAAASAPRPAWPSLAGLRALRPHQLWLHACVALTAILIVWATLFTAFNATARGAGADRVAVMLALSGGDLSDAGLRRYAAHLDPAIVRVALRFTTERNRTRNPFFAPPAQSDVAEPADRQGASFRYQDFTAQQARIWNALVPVSRLPNPAAQPFVLKSDDIVNYQRAVNCLTAAVYYEAASESQSGQQAVAQVVLNRMRHPTFPKSVCGVVFEGSQLSTGCQFSFACDGSLARRPSVEGWARAHGVAVAALGGFVARSVGQATHYHAVYVAPYWSPTLIKVQNIGAHIFYRWMGGSGLPGAFHGAYAGTEPYIAKLAMLDAAFIGQMSDAPQLLIPVSATDVVAPSTLGDSLGLRPAAGAGADGASAATPAPVTTEIAALPQVVEPVRVPQIRGPMISPTPEKAPQRRAHLATPQGW